MLDAAGPADTGRPGGVQQLLACASLAALTRCWPPSAWKAWRPAPRLLRVPGEPLSAHWMEEAASAIALSINTSSCQLDLDGVIVDSAVGGPCWTA
jgi:hypothetical protein